MIRAGLVVGLLSTTALSPTAQVFAFVLGLALLAMLGAVLFVHSDRPVERLLALVAAVMRRPEPGPHDRGRPPEKSVSSKSLHRRR